MAALAAMRGETERAGGRAIHVAADTTKFSEKIEAMRQQIEHELRPVDILVANAGGNYTMPVRLEETSEEGWRASIDGNLTA
jgi:3-oxoacyl-[acyl-carrier protein] reductase